VAGAAADVAATADRTQTRRSNVAIELDHSFQTAKSIDESWKAILDLQRLVPCVDGGSVLGKDGPNGVKAEIAVKMGAMGMKFTGTVKVVEQDVAAHRAVMQVKSKEAGGQGHANATVTMTLGPGGGKIHTSAQITGKAASMGEGVMVGVLDALIKDFTGKLATM
jgi:carbon monoxide dehydrogenase subunit G